MIPLQVLATRKLDKTPLWSEWRPWEGSIAAGFFYTADLAEARERLHEQGHVPMVALSHKRDLRKLVVQLGAERMVIVREPAYAEEVADALWPRVPGCNPMQCGGHCHGEAPPAQTAINLGAPA